MRVLFKQQAANCAIAANRYLQKVKTVGGAFVAAEIASEVVSLCHMPPVVEAMGSIALLGREVHKRRSEPQDGQGLVAWREWFQAQNPDMGESASSDGQEPASKRSLFPLFFAGFMAIDATTSCIDEDMSIIPPWVIEAFLEKTADVLEKTKMLDAEGVAHFRKVLEEIKASEEL